MSKINTILKRNINLDSGVTRGCHIRPLIEKKVDN